MRGMREFEWQLLIKWFYMAVGSKKLILKSPTMNRWSDWEVDDKISFNFVVDSGIFDMSGAWSVNTNDNYGTIVWNWNLSRTILVICMTHWKICHMGPCVTISNKHSVTASCFVNSICIKAMDMSVITRYPQRHDNSDTNEWNSTSFFSKWTYVFMHDEKIKLDIFITTVLKIEVVNNNLCYQHYYYLILLHLWCLCRTYDQSRQMIK